MSGGSGACAAATAGSAASTSTQNRTLTATSFTFLFRRLDPEHHTVCLVGEQVQKAIPPLLHGANSPPQIADQRFPPQLLEILVDQDPIETPGSWNFSVAHAADEDVAFPFRQ